MLKLSSAVHLSGKRKTSNNQKGLGGREGKGYCMSSCMGALGCLVKDCRAERSLAFPANGAENNPPAVPQASVPSLYRTPPAIGVSILPAMTCSCPRNFRNSHSNTENKHP